MAYLLLGTSTIKANGHYLCVIVESLKSEDSPTSFYLRVKTIVQSTVSFGSCDVVDPDTIPELPALGIPVTPILFIRKHRLQPVFNKEEEEEEEPGTGYVCLNLCSPLPPDHQSNIPRSMWGG